MNLSRLLLVGTILSFCISLTAVHSQNSQTQPASESPKSTLSELVEFEKEFKAVPCKGNSERLKAVQALFERLGAPPSNISIETTTNTKNIVLRKPGTSSEIIVIGAHYDKVEHGCGAVDNWTGIVTIAHIYKTIKDLPSKKTVLFVGFGREEEGLLGSSEMVRGTDKNRLNDYCAMINIDSLGLAGPHAGPQMSSRKLLTLTTELARRAQIPFEEISIPGADSDSSSFLKRKIPAISILGLSTDWKRVLHTNQDRSSQVNLIHVYAGYRLALGLYGEIENSACDAFR